jgi:uncharacterized protein
MRFWDASAIVPLLHADSSSEALYSLLTSDADMLVWWGTPVEIVSALARRERDGHLSSAALVTVNAGLQQLAQSWQEVQPSDALHGMAQRLLRLHPLRAADSLQLAAAIVATDHRPSDLEFVCLDERLNAAAQREGFAILNPALPD